MPGTQRAVRGHGVVEAGPEGLAHSSGLALGGQRWSAARVEARQRPWATPTASVNRSKPLAASRLAQLAQDPDRGGRVVEDGGADLDRARAGRDELEGVAAGAHSPDPDDRHRPEPALDIAWRTCQMAAHRDRPDRRAATGRR